ncbi:nitrate- and nitrite sensing domain-containing protein [Planomonospora sp. ID82291]|uniref:sensor histidine kinase n=1 Tax=Planomonospora sp. ID82291 TaxID=2738136 RepID=UPI0018C4431B|nr:nitrate- and nitrite sensing domain-containing protein [Planomonospora sp. ID82291]MBG0812892.1 nitrate- and nitrite sensing domain-containing protein [Planomonospora sp. ID82291]
MPGTEIGGTARRGGRLALRNWRVRSRLIALIAIPTVAAIVLGGLRTVTSLSSAAEYERVRTGAELTAEISGLAHELEEERDLSARFVAQGRGAAALAKLEEQYADVDRMAGDVGDRIDLILGGEQADDFGDRGRDELAQIRNRIDELKSMRATTTKTRLPAEPTIAMYSRTLDNLLALHDEIVQGVTDQGLAAGANAFGALARAKEKASAERAILAVALAERRFTSEGLDAFVAARAGRDSELAAFRSEASVAQRQLFDDTVSSQKKDRAESMRLRALVLASEQAPLVRVDVSRSGAGDQASWFDAASDTVDRMREVEKRIADTVIAQSRALQEAEQRGALITAGLTGLLLLMVLIVTAIMARSLVKPLRRLRTEALSIAGERLPETVQGMRERGEVTAVEVQPIGVVSSDEIGEVARAFDEVHREAVRLAGEEATLRSNVNAMFVNLSRRSQTLVERQLALIESLEHGEQDEGRLGSLFRLDHLATRMRRNSENLLVLAGQEPARRWSQPVPLIDVVRASLSEVENYERVDLRLSGGVSVAGTSVNDVVHLVAELVENAISFSPRETKVIVSSNRIDGGGVMVSVTDLGIGMTAEELAQANWRLANPPVVDVSVSRRMGLFVVGRLALRHGIRVQLRQQDSGGLTAMVLLPESLLAPTGQTPGAPPAMHGGGWGAQAPSAERPPVMASPVSLDSTRPAFASFEAAQQSFGSFDASQSSFGGEGRSPFETGQSSFDAGRSFSSFGGDGRSSTAESHLGRAPVDTPWPGHVPAPGAGPAWPGTSQEDPGSWPSAPPRGDTGVWPDPHRETRQGAQAPRTFDTEADRTGPLPMVREPSALEEGREEFLPIFAAVESDWFRKAEPAAPRADSPSGPGADLRETAALPSPVSSAAPAPEAGSAWSSPADAGWQAARAASEPALGGVTGAGLPKRVPKANLVPGAVAPDAAGAPPAPAPRPAVSPEAVRNRLASFQKGVRQGRAAARGEASEEQAYPGFGRDGEGSREER